MTRPRLGRLLPFVFALCVAPRASAQTGAAAPAASTSTARVAPRPVPSAKAAASATNGAAPAASARANAPGEPPTNGHVAPPSPASAPGSNPHAIANQGELPQNDSEPAADLARGTIEAFVADSERKPLANQEVRLGIMFQKISEGESHTERFARSDAQGRVRFDDLKTGSDYAYRVTLKSGPAEYASFPFNLGDSGQRVHVFVFPVTRDLRGSLIATRGQLYVETREDVFVIDMEFVVFNVGKVTWVPDNVLMRLPAGFKAFNAQKNMTDVGFELVEGQGARLKGTFTPGQHDLRARFQMPKTTDSSAVFHMGGLPHLVQMQVIAEASSQMHLEVDGFDGPQVATNRDGKRVLVSRRSAQRPEDLESDGSFTIALSGIPVPGPGRWIAVVIAALLGGIGLAAARGYMQLDPTANVRQDLLSARELLLEELVDVERARKRGSLGPRAYANARRTLIDAMARLGENALVPAQKKKRRRREAA